jgi:hypothetical protein
MRMEIQEWESYSVRGKTQGKCAQFGAAANWRSLVINVFGAAIISPLSNL